MVQQRMGLVIVIVLIAMTLPALTDHQDQRQEDIMINRERMTVSGTLVLAIPTREGIVICADKRVRPEGLGKPDGFTKIIEVGPTMAISHTGTLGFADPNRSQLLYNPVEVARQFLAQHRFHNNDEYWLEKGSSPLLALLPTL